MSQIGKNTPNAEKLRGIIDELERIEAAKKDLTQQAAAIKAKAKSDGFDPGTISYVMRVRKMKPQDRAEAESLRDVYLHSLDMCDEPPLFRQLRTLVDDAASEEKVRDALKSLAPAKGDIILRMGGKPMRIFRDADGVAKVEDYVEAKPKGEGGGRKPKADSPPAREVPDCTADEAEEMGRQAAIDNKAIIENPFPFGDDRRQRWDAGWRKGSGGDGFGKP